MKFEYKWKTAISNALPGLPSTANSEIADTKVKTLRQTYLQPGDDMENLSERY